MRGGASVRMIRDGRRPRANNDTMPELITVSTAEHLRDARALFSEYAASLSFSLCFQGFNEELASLPGKYSPPGGRLLLAYEGAGAVGCIALRPIGPGVCEMKRLYVRPQCRRTGLGRALAVRLIGEARAIGYARMRLDTTQDMTAAQGLYRSLGFYPIERYNDDHPEHTIWMEMDLGSAGS